MSQVFEDIINKDKALHQLLIEQKVTVFSNFSKNKYDDELKVYINDRYLESFREVYSKRNEPKSGGKITALLRSVEFLATKETRDIIAKELEEKLVSSYKHLNEFRKAVLDGQKELLLESLMAYDALSPVVINILNRFSDYEHVKVYKDKILTCAFDICDVVASANPKSETIKYAIYDTFLNNLERINDYGEHQARFDKHRRKISQKKTGLEIKYWLGVAGAVLLLLLKILSNIL